MKAAVKGILPLAMALVATVPGTGAAAGPAPTCGIADFPQRLLALVNQARATPRQCGTTRHGAAAPLQWNAALSSAAAAHAIDMAGHDYVAHTGRDGRDAGQRLTAQGYRWRAYGENIAAGPDTPEAAVDGWLASPGHCANLMNPGFADIGVACVRNPASTYGDYWAMELGRR